MVSPPNAYRSPDLSAIRRMQRFYKYLIGDTQEGKGEASLISAFHIAIIRDMKTFLSRE